ncbi:hypothetical protein P4H71_23555 [Paenibacillus kribbensis]|uniref:hypothetical protein n=1 Tax=Paenibacillus kribbensis TaxID=172713 RepID=UPI002DBEC8C0|nr:hypothetical protein [Paenibacillus kribbensis]MEC0237305.1 hypothetical protein [Paenibacillus kribbensis]
MEIHTANCPKCGSVFRRNLRNLCNTCIQEENVFFDRCSNYLWKHPATHTRQLSAVTGTPMNLLTDWVRAGKFPSTYSQLDYPCESCQSPIYAGRLCHSCLGTFRTAALDIQTRIPRRTATGLFSIAERVKSF